MVVESTGVVVIVVAVAEGTIIGTVRAIGATGDTCFGIGIILGVTEVTEAF